MNVERQRLRVSICTSICPTCSMPTDSYPMFESGPGGDFETWIDESKGLLFRVDAALVRYGLATHEQILRRMAEIAGSPASLRKLPHDLACKCCGKSFNPQSSGIDGNEVRETIVVGP